ncbi:MAG: polysaccharide biosynthesis/export family protein [bacterium]|nr:polysaccharide biosynthesis/export family protein [bacterium]
MLCSIVASFAVTIFTQAPAILPGQERYRIGYQDRVTVQVFRRPELTQTVDVNPNGTISLFRLPEPVVAVCKTEGELASDIADAYRKDYLRNPEVKVIVSEQRSQAFAVIGAVVKPAQYVVSKRIRLLELLSLAGGPSPEAGSRLILARTGSTATCKDGAATQEVSDVLYADFKIKDVLEARENPEVRPGDIVSVLEEDSVYVYGNVIKQGQVKFKEPITLMQAIASAEGLKPAAKKDKIRVLRQKSGSLEKEELIFDLGKISKTGANDPFLQPNDIVAVSEDAAKSIFQGISRSLTQGLPSIFYRFP